MSLRRPALVAAAVLTLVGAAGCSTDSVHALEIGDCLDSSDLQGEEIESAAAVDCAEEHDAEIIAEHVFPGDDYPGVDAVAEKSEAACTEEFEEFIGVPYQESALTMTMLRPSEDSWNNADDRSTLCIVVSEEPVTGSLEGANV